MKIYRQPDGRCNISGTQIKARREACFLSQEQLAAKAQLAGLNLTQKAISRIETGEPGLLQTTNLFNLLKFFTHQSQSFSDSDNPSGHKKTDRMMSVDTSLCQFFTAVSPSYSAFGFSI